jgi:hypothetical protein
MKWLEKMGLSDFLGEHHSIDGHALFGQTISEETNKNLKIVLSVTSSG